MAREATEALTDADAARPKPVLFLHIPKTAGTSFLLTLQNTFGDKRVRRIRQVDDRIGEAVDRIVQTDLSRISCLAGHLPIHLFDGMLDRFHPFTVLREPGSRVLSLYRFLRDGDPAVPQRLGLRPGFSLEEFLNFGHPEVYSQVNNGMVRLLCGNPRLVYPGNPFLWDIGSQIDTLQHALANLQKIDFGLAEAFPATLALAQARWGIPYNLGEHRENTTTHDVTGEEAALIHRIVSQNTADLALYHQARTIFHARTKLLPSPDPTPADGWNWLSVFAPSINHEAKIGDIPGRTGFHEFETSDLAWLHADQQSGVYFEFGQDLMRLRLRIYCVIPQYPVGNIAVNVNDRRVQTQVTFEDDRWCLLETEHFETRDGINRFTIAAPLFIPAADRDPGSKDRRRLGIALSHVQIGP